MQCACYVHVKEGLQLCGHDATYRVIQRRRAQLVDLHYQVFMCAEHAIYMKQEFAKTFFSMELLEPPATRKNGKVK